MNLVVTGYYKKHNYGDDLFEAIADKLFQKEIFKQRLNRYKIVPIQKINLNENRNMPQLVVLFGGETLNDFFLDELLTLHAYDTEQKRTDPKRKGITFKAVGVSCNQSYESVAWKLHLFDQIIFRAQRDYAYFADRLDNCSWCPDIVFTLRPERGLNLSWGGKTVGFFLSQTALTALTPEGKKAYVNQMCGYVRAWLAKGFRVKLFAMCTNAQVKTENDNLLNGEIFKGLTRVEQERVKVYRSTEDILGKFPRLDFSVCWRYHAHVLSIIYNVPFLSLSTTPKVACLLTEAKLTPYVCLAPEDFNTRLDRLLTNQVEVRKQLKTLYIEYHALAKGYTSDIYTTPCSPRKRYFIGEKARAGIAATVQAAYVERQKLNASPEVLGQTLLFALMRTVKNDYLYGLTEKITQGLTVRQLKPEIDWLVNECILTGHPMFYAAHQTVKATGWLNVKYMDQDEYKGLHRAGWSYVVNGLAPFHDGSKTRVDLYLDRTFHWNAEAYTAIGLTPYKTPWVGFIHHTVDVGYSGHNTVVLFQNPAFLASLPSCMGLCVLSEHLKTAVVGLLMGIKKDIPVHALTHPTEFVLADRQFTMAKFKANKDRKVIQIGAWMRNLDAINALNPVNPLNPLNLVKAALIGKKMEGFYAAEEVHPAEEDPVLPMSRDNTDRRVRLDPDVRRLTFLENGEYDLLLSENVVFLNLIGASAVNTILECIVRHTPILVNRLPATEEALGPDYPLFYTTMAEASALLTMEGLTAGHTYLKKMHKDKFKIETFQTALRNIIS